MGRKKPEDIQAASRDRIAQIQEEIRALTYVCSGTLLRRWMTCGKTTCRCATDPDARHGPYYEWGRMKRGKLVHRMIPAHQAPLLRMAIQNYRTLRRLLRAWEEQTVRIIGTEKPHK